MRISATRKLHFCAGHRVMGHENKCGHSHGHNYNIELTAQVDLSKSSHQEVLARLGAPEHTDDLGRVIDFSVLKGLFDPWIQEKWDHGVILNEKDDVLVTFFRTFQASDGTPQKLYTLPYNPTAENIGRYLIQHVAPALLEKLPVTLVKVVVHETDNCFATVELT